MERTGFVEGAKSLGVLVKSNIDSALGSRDDPLIVEEESILPTGLVEGAKSIGSKISESSERTGLVEGAKRFGGFVKSKFSREEGASERTGLVEGAKRLGGYVKSKVDSVRASGYNPLEEITESNPLEHTLVPKEGLWATVKSYGSNFIPDGGVTDMFLQKEEQEKADHDLALELDRKNRDQLMEEQRTSGVPQGRLSRARSYYPSARSYDKRPFENEEGSSANKRRKVADSDYVPKGRNVGADPAKVANAEEGLKKEGGVNDLMMMMMMMQQIQSAMHYSSDRGMADSYVPSQLSSYRMHSSDLTV